MIDGFAASDACTVPVIDTITVVPAEKAIIDASIKTIYALLYLILPLPKILSNSTRSYLYKNRESIEYKDDGFFRLKQRILEPLI
jgi:hypothetical protein